MVSLPQRQRLRGVSLSLVYDRQDSSLRHSTFDIRHSIFAFWSFFLIKLAASPASGWAET
jgi:hypothetical protein